MSTAERTKWKAREVFTQKNGDVTKAYYEELASVGPIGRVAVALFRAQKRSTAAKKYRRGKWTRAAYDVKQWSMDQLCQELEKHGNELGIRYGWKRDSTVLFGDAFSWVLYVDLWTGQVSFHSPARGQGPDYPGIWDGVGESEHRILRFCDSVMG